MLQEQIETLEKKRDSYLNNNFFSLIKKRNNAFQEEQELKILKKTSQNLSYTQKAELNRKYYDTYLERRYYTSLLDQLKAPMAELSAKIAMLKDEQAKNENKYVELDTKNLGGLYSVGELPIGSPAWHEERLKGIGGSDVGKLLTCGYLNYLPQFRALPVNPYSNSKDWDYLAQLKAGIITQTHEEEDRTNLLDAANRGAYCEDYIRHMFTEKHPELQIIVCKDSWRGTGCEYAHANFDGLISTSRNNTPTHILEIKTGTTIQKNHWGENGKFEQTPLNYQLQAIWYTYWAGLKGGWIVALLDEHDYREYYFDLQNPYVQNLLKLILDGTKKFWEDVQKYSNKTKQPTPPVTIKGFPKNINPNKELEYIQALMDFDTKKQTQDFITNQHGSLTPTNIRKTLQNITTHTKNIPLTERKHKLIGIDLECNSITPSQGVIIETAIIEYSNNQGETKTLINTLHGLNQKEKTTTGTGAKHIHQISENMIKEKPRFFDDTLLHQKILNILKNNILIAHNANYEIGFLTTWLPGFAQMLDNKEILIIDTMNLTKWYMKGPDNKLETFCTQTGIKYENAHRSLQDTQMMMRALAKWINNQYH